MKLQHYAFIRNLRRKHIGIGAACAILVTIGILVAQLAHTPLVSGAGQPLNGGPGYNNEGVSPKDGASTLASFDGGGASYSSAALTALGFAPGYSVTFAGVTFLLPAVTNGIGDNWQASGQVVPVSVSGGGRVAFLGAASQGVSSGATLLTYTDGTTQPFTLTFSDWTLDGGHSAPAPQDTIAAKMSYHDTSSGGRLTVTTYLFFTSTPTDPNKTVRSVRLPFSASGGQLHVFAVGNTTPSPSATADWPTYLGDLGRSGYNATETTLGANDIAALRVRWQALGAQGITIQPIEANNTLYWGSWDGLLHATSVNGGADTWTANLGQTHDTNCYPPTAGIASSATIGAIGATPVVFVGGGNATFYAVNAQTGAILWSTRLGSSPDNFIWSSPAVYNGSVYIGLASFSDCPLVPGKLFQLDATTGAIQHTFSTTPNDTCLGAGVWSSPTIDTTTNTLYFSTGNSGPCSTSEPYAVSLIALRASDLSLVSYWQIPSSQQGPDGDFGATATLFGATVNGAQRAMIGLPNKNGYYYAFDRANLSAGPLWRTQIARPGDCPQCGDGSISPSAWDGVTLYVAGGGTLIGGKSCSGGVRALNPATGAVLWARCLQNSLVGPVLGAVTAMQGVVIVTTGKQILALSAATGNAIFSYTDNASNSLFYGPVCIVNGHLYAGNLDGNFFAFGL